MATPNTRFTGYSPDKLQRLAHSYGYTDANLAGFGKFLEENPARAKQYFDQQNLDMFGEERMRQFQAGGFVFSEQGKLDRARKDAARFNVDTEDEDSQGELDSLEEDVRILERQRESAASAYGAQQTAEAAAAQQTTGAAQQTPVVAAQQTPAAAQQSVVDSIASGVDPTGGGAQIGIRDTRYRGDVPQPVVTPQIGRATAQRLQDPQIPAAAVFEAPQIPYDPQQQLMREGIGQVVPEARTIADAATAEVATQDIPAPVAAREMDVTTVAPAIQDLVFQAAEKQTPTQIVEAATEEETAVSNLEAAEVGQAVEVDSPAERALKDAEKVSLAVGQAAQAAEWTEPIAQAATATPTESATVQGQLAILMKQFEDTEETPIWAKGAIRLAQQEMAKRGLGASSMAGQAMVEAAMEKAITIAQIDAQVIAAFEKENLSNRQQMATLRAQQRASFMNQEFDTNFKTRVQNAARISDIADKNFSAEQQIALENAKMAQTVDLENLSNSQALVIATATTIANLETTNLNNRQKAAVENAKNFLQLDMRNLDNAQQSAKIAYEQIAQSLLTDAAQQNAANKINMTEENQMNQWNGEMVANISKANADQTNAINKFNAGEINSIQEYNSEVVNKRDQFNAKNQLVIEQSNAVWRRDIATADTAALNFQNQFNAQNVLDISQQAYDNLWQEYRDIMDFAWQSGESEIDRIHALQMLAAQAENSQLAAQYQADRENSAGIGGWLGDIFAPFARTVVGTIFDITPTPAD